MKIIFLDVDGVLAYSSYSNSNTANIDISKVQMIKEICDKTGAKVVISSSWKGDDKIIPDIYYILVNVLESNGIEVLGHTEYIPVEFDGDVPQSITITTLEDLPYFKSKYGTGRAAEVQKWIKEHAVDNFVILDDEDFDWADYGYDKHWVAPSWFECGLQREHVDKSIKILKGDI